MRALWLAGLIGCGGKGSIATGEDTGSTVTGPASVDTGTPPSPTDTPTSSTDPWTPPTSTADDWFAPGRVLDVHIAIDPADADTLAAQTNDQFELLLGEECMSEPWNGPYTWFPVDVTVDGVRVEEAGVRKKGLIGSLSEDKPSLKLKFDKYVEDQTLDGMERLTLNNAISDPTLVRQCLGYQLFADAGLPSPRCNFAHVVVNDDDLGIYVNVEPVKKDFLKWAFDGDDDGHLYEGTLSDFREGWTDTFDVETSDTDVDRAPIHALAEALAIPDDAAMLAAVEAQVDLDAFYDFWAMEVLLNHVDGYAGNANNYFVYWPEETGRAVFLPWGIDAVMYGSDIVGGEPAVVFAGTQLPRRLWDHPPSRERYLAALERLLDEVWDEAALHAQVDWMAGRVEADAWTDPYRDAWVADLHAFIDGRRPELEALLAGPPPGFEGPLRDELCLVYGGEMRVDFDTTWDSLFTYDPLGTGWGAASGVLDGDPFAWEGGAIAGSYYGTAQFAALALTSPTLVDYAVVWVPDWMLVEGTIPLDGWTTPVLYVTIDITDDSTETVGSLWDAELVLTEFDGIPGSPVRGYFRGDLYTGGPYQ